MSAFSSHSKNLSNSTNSTNSINSTNSLSNDSGTSEVISNEKCSNCVSRKYLAIDLGASGGRLIVGHFDGQKLILEELWRFENAPIFMSGRLFWNLPQIWKNILDGLKRVGKKYGSEISSIGVDTWGVDFVFLAQNSGVAPLSANNLSANNPSDHFIPFEIQKFENKKYDGEILGNPRCYRDPRTDGMMDKAFQIVSKDKIFASTGLQFMQFNTLYQLLAMKEEGSVILKTADCFLMMPDLFHWLLSGIASNELTNATTTQCFDPQSNDWARSLLNDFGLPTAPFLKISPPGTVLGPLRPELVQETGLTSAQIVLPGTHDTASAVLAVPAIENSKALNLNSTISNSVNFNSTNTNSANPNSIVSNSTNPNSIVSNSKNTKAMNWAYVSLGTWALMGIESPAPIINETVSRYNFTNEGGVGGTTRVLKNICGLWILQECRRNWLQQGLLNEEGKSISWNDMTRWTQNGTPFMSFIDPDARDFLTPTDMPAAIQEFTQRTGQQVPETKEQILRTVLDSLAMKFRLTLEMCSEIGGQKIETLHLVGGGIQNQLLCQAAANATGCRVVAGPIEATAIGNIMMQAVAFGDIADIPNARLCIQESFGVQEYLPENAEKWNSQYSRFLDILQKTKN